MCESKEKRSLTRCHCAKFKPLPNILKLNSWREPRWHTNAWSKLLVIEFQMQFPEAEGPNRSGSHKQRLQNGGMGLARGGPQHSTGQVTNTAWILKANNQDLEAQASMLQSYRSIQKSWIKSVGARVGQNPFNDMYAQCVYELRSWFDFFTLSKSGLYWLGHLACNASPNCSWVLVPINFFGYLFLPTVQTPASNSFASSDPHHDKKDFDRHLNLNCDLTTCSFDIWEAFSLTCSFHIWFDPSNAPTRAHDNRK